MILLDTDIAVDVVREFQPAVMWVSSTRREAFAISGFTAAELFAGCRSRTEQQKLQRTLKRFRMIWLSSLGCDAALGHFRELGLIHGIGLLDCFIGQTAVESELPLHTFNLKHFLVYPGLNTIQPYSRASTQ